MDDSGSTPRQSFMLSNQDEATQAREYLSRLLRHVAPQCEPLPTLLGVCTQIDNYRAGSQETPRWQIDEGENLVAVITQDNEGDYFVRDPSRDGLLVHASTETEAIQRFISARKDYDSMLSEPDPPRPVLFTAHPDGIYREISLDVVRSWSQETTAPHMPLLFDERENLLADIRRLRAQETPFYEMPKLAAAETERRHSANCRAQEAQRQREADALQAGFELGLPETPRWQPIESAPKGTVVLAWGRGDGPGASPWIEKVWWWESSARADSCWTFDTDGCKAEPEGWMPLPSPPEGAHD